MTRNNLCLLALLTLGLSPLSAQQAVTVPNTFTAGQPAKAEDVNANFAALATAINNLQGQVTKLQGGVAQSDLVGSYTFMTFGTNFGSTGGPGGTAATGVWSTQGTMTFSSDGTFSLSSTEPGWGWGLGGTSVTITPWVDPAMNGVVTKTGTWTYSKGVLSVGGGSLAFNTVGGGQLMISITTAAMTYAAGPGGQVILYVLVRQ